MSELQITSMAQLTSYAKGQVVQFPDFAEGQPFVARISRPSMMDLARGGNIPNSLLVTANELFAGKGIDTKKATALDDVFQVIDLICESCFLEPTWSELKQAGVKLTDEQYMFIFNYTQQGVQALKNFRVQPSNPGTTINVSEVSKDPI